MNTQNCPHIGEMFYRAFRVFTIVIGIVWAGIIGHMMYCQKMAPLMKIGEMEPRAFRVLSELLILGLVGMWLTRSLDPKPPPVHKN